MLPVATLPRAQIAKSRTAPPTAPTAQQFSGEIQVLKAEKAALGTAVDKLEVEKTGVGAEIDSLRERKSSLEGEVKGLEDKNGVLEGELAGLEEKKSGLESELEGLQEKKRGIPEESSSAPLVDDEFENMSAEIDSLDFDNYMTFQPHEERDESRAEQLRANFNTFGQLQNSQLYDRPAENFDGNYNTFGPHQPLDLDNSPFHEQSAQQFSGDYSTLPAQQGRSAQQMAINSTVGSFGPRDGAPRNPFGIPGTTAPKALEPLPASPRRRDDNEGDGAAVPAKPRRRREDGEDVAAPPAKKPKPAQKSKPAPKSAPVHITIPDEEETSSKSSGKYQLPWPQTVTLQGAIKSAGFNNRACATLYSNDRQGQQRALKFTEKPALGVVSCTLEWGYIQMDYKSPSFPIALNRFTHIYGRVELPQGKTVWVPLERGVRVVNTDEKLKKNDMAKTIIDMFVQIANKTTADETEVKKQQTARLARELHGKPGLLECSL
ncbi:hypothetical protein HDK77DRAFT_514786 [Phyllosticta capitalensis]